MKIIMPKIICWYSFVKIKKLENSVTVKAKGELAQKGLAAKQTNAPKLARLVGNPRINRNNRENNKKPRHAQGTSIGTVHDPLPK
jgi:hypothetical protein